MKINEDKINKLVQDAIQNALSKIQESEQQDKQIKSEGSIKDMFKNLSAKPGAKKKIDPEKAAQVKKSFPQNTQQKPSNRDEENKDSLTEDEELEEQSVFHACAAHVKENATGRKGRPINHTLLEDGTVTHYTVEFESEIVENIPLSELIILKEKHEPHGHANNREDDAHDKKRPRREHREEKPLKEWYDNSIYGKLLEKYTRRK